MLCCLALSASLSMSLGEHSESLGLTHTRRRTAFIPSSLMSSTHSRGSPCALYSCHPLASSSVAPLMSAPYQKGCVCALVCVAMLAMRVAAMMMVRVMVVIRVGLLVFTFLFYSSQRSSVSV